MEAYTGSSLEGRQEMQNCRKAGWQLNPGKHARGHLGSSAWSPSPTSTLKVKQGWELSCEATPTTAKARKGEICAYTQGSTLNPGQQGHLWAMGHFIFYLLIPSIINMDFLHEINKYIKHKIQCHKMCLFHTQI